MTAGQSVTDSFNYTIENGEDAGDTATSTISIDITGSDDGPALNIVDPEGFVFNILNPVPTDVVGTAETIDLFTFENGALTSPEPFVISDFEPTEDVLDLSNLPQGAGFTPGSSAIEDYVRLVDDGTDTTVQIDADGPGGDDYVDLAVLDDVTGADGISIIVTPVVSS